MSPAVCEVRCTLKTQEPPVFDLVLPVGALSSLGPVPAGPASTAAMFLTDSPRRRLRCIWLFQPATPLPLWEVTGSHIALHHRGDAEDRRKLQPGAAEFRGCRHLLRSGDFVHRCVRRPGQTRLSVRFRTVFGSEQICDTLQTTANS